VLLFELFPAVLAIISVLVGIGLYVAERRARNAGIDDSRPIGSRPDATEDQRKERPSRGRPSMRS
jgi:hypothetical protein